MTDSLDCSMPGGILDVTLISCAPLASRSWRPCGASATGTSFQSNFRPATPFSNSCSWASTRCGKPTVGAQRAPGPLGATSSDTKISSAPCLPRNSPTILHAFWMTS